MHGDVALVGSSAAWIRENCCVTVFRAPPTDSCEIETFASNDAPPLQHVTFTELPPSDLASPKDASVASVSTHSRSPSLASALSVSRRGHSNTADSSSFSLYPPRPVSLTHPFPTITQTRCGKPVSSPARRIRSWWKPSATDSAQSQPTLILGSSATARPVWRSVRTLSTPAPYCTDAWLETSVRDKDVFVVQSGSSQ